MIAELSEDLRFGFRVLSKRPAFAAVAILSLALGIGANSAIFSLLDAVFFRPLAVETPETLVQIRTVDRSSELELGAVSRDNLRDIRAAATSFVAVEGEVGVRAALQLPAEAEPVIVAGVTGGFFEMLGADAALGRWIDDRDAGSEQSPRIVLAHHLWKDRFGADREIVGKRVRLSGVDFEVVGVAASSFAGVSFPMVPQGWIHVDHIYRVDSTMAGILSRRGLTHHVVGRLAPGVALEAARAEVQGIGTDLERRYPEANANRNYEVVSLQEARMAPGIRPMAERAGLLMIGIVGFILLIACANVANLLLARAGERRSEIAVRLAVGGTPRRILRQLLTESVLLALLGGALGIVLALWGVDLIWSLQPGEVWDAPPLEVGLDGRILTFTLALSLCTALAFGLLPAWRSAHEPLVSALRSDEKVSGLDGRPPRIRRVLVSGQVALSLVAMIGAGLFVRSLQEARAVDPGFGVDGTGVIELSLPTDFDRERRAEIYRAALSATRGVPGVEAAGMAEDPPMRRSVMRTMHRQEADGSLEAGGPIFDVTGVTTGYFETLGIERLRGAEFGRERADSGFLQAIVNESAAAKLWPKGEAVGKRFRFAGFPISHEVIGVVSDTRGVQIQAGPQPMVYVWMPQQRHPRSSVILQAGDDIDRVLPEVEAALRELDPRVAVHGAMTLREVVDGALWGTRMGAGLLSAFAGLALLLAAIGVYGLSSYVVTRRTREVGIRMALGADPMRLRRMLVRQALAPVLAGVAAGLLLALIFSPLLEDMLYQVAPADPRAYLPAAILLVAVGVLAAWIPARRTTRLDPMEALRT